MDNVSHSSQEQMRGIGQVAAAIRRMEQETQTAAAGAQQGAASAQELSAQSDNLKSIVAQLTTVVGAVDARSR